MIPGQQRNVFDAVAAEQLHGVAGRFAGGVGEADDPDRHATGCDQHGTAPPRGNRRRRGVDRGFVVSDHADWDSLLRTCRGTGARRVLATHGNTEALVRVLCDEGLDAAVIPIGDHFTMGPKDAVRAAGFLTP